MQSLSNFVSQLADVEYPQRFDDELYRLYSYDQNVAAQKLRSCNVQIV